ncbi:DUF3865 domain-containing protein [Nocardia sp. CDC159]|uniref:DUF3865 domain-containing protein n=1 Tax=Nocardia pulmonis TaxID=2951408 RepID=A0A9X2IZ14_9NOCA|nr:MULTISPECIES: DUF3865 domain-containing protein [Nocardia]MCM6774461.1 DUF3865 domain-containing protein [Nocardia pulmonis]MCM6787473.1 DUF3865 domain-containing protein [Nocardia sp. CDC159]
MTQQSTVDAYLDTHPDTKAVIEKVLLNAPDVTGDELIDKHLAPMMDGIFELITEQIAPQNLSVQQAELYIKELSVFARYNAQFLRRAAASVEGACFELAHEFRRNHLEEGGERGHIPAHYTLYSGALLADLGLRVNGHVPAPETLTLLTLHDLLVEGSSASTICGGYYATEGVAINETVLLRSITDRYGELTVGAPSAQLPALDYYYQLHLDEEHEAAAGDGLSVEAAHIEGIATFIRNRDLYHLDLPQILDGFLQILEGMARWWGELTVRAHSLP